MQKTPPIIHVMTEAVRKAGGRLRRDFGEIEHLQVLQKGPADFVTTADHRSEEILHRELSKAHPTYGFLFEERGEVKGDDEHRWIVDSVDGTSNLMHGIPHFCISLALEVRGEITAGIVYQPLTDEVYWAAKGEGAYLNDRRLKVSGHKNLHEVMAAVLLPFRGFPIQNLFPLLENLSGKITGVRNYGSAALDLAYVAAGRLDASWGTNLKLWDIAAGVLLVQEAGGVLSDHTNSQNYMTSGNVLATNYILAEEIRHIMKC